MSQRSAISGFTQASSLLVLCAACATSENAVVDGTRSHGAGGQAGTGGAAGSAGGSAGASAGGGAGAGSLMGVSGATTFGGTTSAGSGGMGGSAGSVGAGTGGTEVTIAGAGGEAGASGGTTTVDPCAAAAISARATWLATASPGADSAANAVDEDASTRFTTGAKMVGGEWLQIDFGVSVALSEVTMFTSAENDYPRMYELRLSDTSQNDAVTPLTSGAGTAQFTAQWGSVEQGRYLYITQTGVAEGVSWWSVHNLTVACN